MVGEILIDGAWRRGAGAEFESIDPSTGEAVWRGAGASSADVSDAVAAAHRAFESWAITPLKNRIEIVERYRDLIQRDADDLARLISKETGKPHWETKTEAAAVAGKVDISIRAYTERTGERRNTVGATEAVLRHKPHGVLAVLGPYNFPAHLPNGHIVPALIAGDTVVFKPSELAPGPGAFIIERMVEAGVPQGVVNLVQGGRETGEALTNADINGVLFTGARRNRPRDSQTVCGPAGRNSRFGTRRQQSAHMVGYGRYRRGRVRGGAICVPDVGSALHLRAAPDCAGREEG